MFLFLFLFLHDLHKLKFPARRNAQKRIFRISFPFEGRNDRNARPFFTFPNGCFQIYCIDMRIQYICIGFRSDDIDDSISRTEALLNDFWHDSLHQVFIFRSLSMARDEHFSYVHCYNDQRGIDSRRSWRIFRPMRTADFRTVVAVVKMENSHFTVAQLLSTAWNYGNRRDAIRGCEEVTHARIFAYGIFRSAA